MGASGGAISGNWMAHVMNQMVPVDDANPEGPKKKRAVKQGKIAQAKIGAAFSAEELAVFRALWLAQSGGVQPMNDRQLIMFGKNMLKNQR